MRTDELERLLAEALHEGDALLVDTAAGERRLVLRESERMPTARRWSVVLAAAASVLVIVLTTVLALDALRGEDRREFTPAPRVTLSPSGLPVGSLVGRVDRTESGVTSNVRLVVRPDGTGSFNAGTVGDAEGDSVADYAVDLVAAAPGRAVMRNRSEAACFATDVMTLHFTVHPRTVRITDISDFLADCIVSRGLAADLPGTTLRIEPLPLELSPSGLPVGLLKGSYAMGGGLGTLRLLVRADGTGQLEYPQPGNQGFGVGPLDIVLGQDGSGLVTVSFDNPVCADSLVLEVTVRVSARQVTLLDVAHTDRCAIDPALARALPGLVLDVLPAPARGLSQRGPKI